MLQIGTELTVIYVELVALFTMFCEIIQQISLVRAAANWLHGEDVIDSHCWANN